MVVDTLRTLTVKPLVHTEQIHQLGGQPETARRAAEKVKGFGKALPDPAVIGLDRSAVAGRHP